MCGWGEKGEMCGISGILRSERAAGAPRLDDSKQRHRGPDDSGTYRDPHERAELWFRRLAILDLSPAGHQPMSNEDGTVWVVFNGEIYNHQPLRQELERLGHRFKSRADTEVLVHLWEEHGRGMVDRLNGMFAFCIWDERTGEAFLARDHAGIKPLYWTTGTYGLAFASEAKVLLDLPELDRSIDPVSLQQYLTFLWVPGERTMWKGIRKLAAGGWLSWKADRPPELGTWWDWDQSKTDDDASPEEHARQLGQVLREAVDRQLMSDVPLGVQLSGGLDSSIVAGTIRALRPDAPLRAYTTRFGSSSQDGFADDLPYAREVARFLRADLVEEEIRPEISQLLPFLVWHSDEPLADPALATSYLLCKRAREDGTVVLMSGQGADELFHGYRSHRAYSLADRFDALPRPAIRLATALVESIARRTGSSAHAVPRRAARMLRFLGASAEERILALADWSSATWREKLLSPKVRDETSADPYREYCELFERSRAAADVDRWSYVLFKTFLPALNLTYGDRTSMATSVELRVPFLDRAVVEHAGRIPPRLKVRRGAQKWVLAEAANGSIPPSIRTRPKTGFGAPIREWLRGPLRPYTKSLLLGERFEARGLFSREAVVAMLRDLETGAGDVAYLVWALLTFELWAKTFVDGDGAAPVPLLHRLDHQVQK